MMNLSSQITSLLVVGIIVSIALLVILWVVRGIRDKARKASELIFGEPKKKSKPKSPNAILGMLFKFSQIVFKMKTLEKLIPYPKGLAEKKIEHDLMLASKPFDLDPKSLTQLKVFCALVFFLLLYIVAANNPASKSFYYYAVIFGVIGYFYPNLFITNLLQVRKQKISRLIPDAMDFISLCLAAGMNFQLAVEEYIKRNNNLLADEFMIFSNEMQVGISRVDGFQHMLDRNESPELKNFLSSVIQSERLGTPLRPVITNQAIELRGKRKQLVEKAIASAPVKMLFPLILFILPAMLMIILGSVLLPATKMKSIIFQTEKFYFYQVTAQVKVTINGTETPLIHVRKGISPGTDQLFVLADKGEISSYAQQQYLVNFFKEHGDREDAWFVRIDLPENTLNMYTILIVPAENTLKPKTVRLLIHYIRFDVEGFKETTMTQKRTSMQLRGHISPGIVLAISMNEKPVEFKSFNQETGDFETAVFNLTSDRSRIKFTMTLKTGLKHEVEKVVTYTGINLSASIPERSPTLKEKVKIIGIASPGSRLTVKKYAVKENKFLVIHEQIVGETRGFDVEVPLTLDYNNGENLFRLQVSKDGEQSPVLPLSIIRSLSE